MTNSSADMDLSPHLLSFQLAGRRFSLSAAEVVAVVRHAIAQGLPADAQSYRVWYFTVDGVHLNVKWVIELATGLERSEYNSIMAKEILRRLGLDVQRIGADNPILREAYAGATGGRGRSIAAPPEIHAILDAEVDAMRLFLLGRSARPSDERLCDLVHFCYTFALYTEATQLFRLVDPTQVNAWYYERTRRLAKASALRL